ncbi:MAG: helix-turn-helix transcriptional regulator [Alistipes sp.]
MKAKQPRRTDDQLIEMVIQRIKQLRNEHGFSQEYVIAQTRLDISSLETGRTAPTLFSISILCRFYHITLSEFFAAFYYPQE